MTELLSKYFNIGDSYAYNLTRGKSAFSCGTVRLDDFEEFDDETVADIADYLITNGVTVQSDKDINAPSKWIPVTEKLPDKDGDYLVFKRFALNAWSDVVSFAKDGRKVDECAFEEKWQNVWYYYDSEWGYIRTMPLPTGCRFHSRRNEKSWKIY